MTFHPLMGKTGLCRLMVLDVSLEWSLGTDPPAVQGHSRLIAPPSSALSGSQLHCLPFPRPLCYVWSFQALGPALSVSPAVLGHPT